jgi:hypothetical protein
MESALISKKIALATELRLMARGGVRFDPARKQQLLTQLFGIERDIGRMSFTKEEIIKNDVRYGGASSVVSGSAQHYIPPAIWSSYETPEKAEPRHLMMSRSRLMWFSRRSSDVVAQSWKIIGANFGAAQ